MRGRGKLLRANAFCSLCCNADELLRPASRKPRADRTAKTSAAQRNSAHPLFAGCSSRQSQSISIFSHEIPRLIGLSSPESPQISPDPPPSSSIAKERLAFPFLRVVCDPVGGHSPAN